MNSLLQKEYKIISFRTPKALEKWLFKNHAKTNGIWLRFFKKNSGVKTITYPEALDEALCFGWIDGQIKKYDEQSYILKFTPRRQRSMWSKRNTEHIERLTKLGKMHPAGLKQVEEAKADWRWEKAYQSPTNITVPHDFIEALSKYKKAKAFYETLNKVNKYYIAYQMTTAKKPETRQNRMGKILQMLKEGKKFN